MVDKQTLLGELMFESADKARSILMEKVQAREIQGFSFVEPNSVKVILLTGESVTIGPA